MGILPITPTLHYSILLGYQLTQGQELSLDPGEGASVLLVGKRELELVFGFLFGFFEFLARSVDRETLGIEQAFDIQQELDVSLFI